jgi:hypothetical protein
MEVLHACDTVLVGHPRSTGNQAIVVDENQPTLELEGQIVDFVTGNPVEANRLVCIIQIRVEQFPGVITRKLVYKAVSDEEIPVETGNPTRRIGS